MIILYTRNKFYDKCRQCQKYSYRKYGGNNHRNGNFTIRHFFLFITSGFSREGQGLHANYEGFIKGYTAPKKWFFQNWICVSNRFCRLFLNYNGSCWFSYSCCCNTRPPHHDTFDHSLSTDKLFNTFCVHKSSSHKQIEAEPIALPIDATLHDKLFAVTFVKLFNTTTSLSCALLTSEERMAFGANVYTKVFFYRASFECVATTASYCSFFIVWMNTLFHSIHLFPTINIILIDYSMTYAQMQVANTIPWMLAFLQ